MTSVLRLGGELGSGGGLQCIVILHAAYGLSRIVQFRNSIHLFNNGSIQDIWKIIWKKSWQKFVNKIYANNIFICVEFKTCTCYIVLTVDQNSHLKHLTRFLCVFIYINKNVHDFNFKYNSNTHNMQHHYAHECFK